MQLKQPGPILRPQQLVHQGARTRVTLLRHGLAHQGQITFQFVQGLLQQAADAGGSLAGFLRQGRIQPIPARARVGVDVLECRGLLLQVAHTFHQQPVLEHVGVVTGVIVVLIT